MNKRIIRKDQKYHTIFFDMDGVLTDFSGACCKFFDINPDDPTIRQIMKDDLPLEDHFAEGGRDEFLDMINNKGGYNFWMEMPMYAWAKELYSTVEETVGKYNVYFLTSHAHFPSAIQAKADYVLKHFNSDRIVVTKYKSLLAKSGAILIDDMDYNIKPFIAAGGDGFKWPNPWKIKDKEVDLQDTIDQLIHRLTVKDLALA